MMLKDSAVLHWANFLTILMRIGFLTPFSLFPNSPLTFNQSTQITMPRDGTIGLTRKRNHI